MKRKSIVVLLVLLSVILLAGWGKKQVELLNDKKLIDLSKAIENCIGADSLKPSDDTGSEINPDGGTQSDSGDAASEREIIISVRNKTVTYDNTEWTNLNTLETKIRQDFKGNVVFKLVDDYAEAHVYRYLMKVLEELQAEMGITYTMEQGGSVW